MKRINTQIFTALFLIFFANSAHAENILIIGDSLTCGSFGEEFFKNLDQNGNTVSLYCAISSAPSHWLNGVNPKGQICQTRSSEVPALKPCAANGKVPTLESLLHVYSSATVIVALGTNSLLSPQVTSDYQIMVNTVKAHGACEWIGPPNLRPDQSAGFPAGRIAKEQANLESFYDSLETTVSTSCRFFDSRAATASGTPGNDTVDGVHRTQAAGIYWADAINQN